MRKLLPLTLLALPALGIACTAILGDFTVTDAGGSDTGGDTVGDAGSDSDAVAPAPLRCAEQGSSRFQLTKGNTLHPANVRVATTIAGKVRIIVPDYEMDDAGQSNALVQGFTFDPHDTSSTPPPATLVTMGSRVYSIARYEGVKPGFAVLYDQYVSSASSYFLFAARLPDDAASWTAPVELVSLGMSNNTSATFVVVDAAIEAYYVVVSQTSGASQTILAASPKGGILASFTTLDTFTTVQSDRGVFDLVEPGIAMQGAQPYIALAPSGNNGPPPQGTPVKILVPGQGDLTITPPSNLNYFPSAFTNGVDPLKINAAFLVANLNTLTGAYHIGQPPFASMSTFDPQQLPATPPPFTSADGGSLKDLFVGGSNQHWEVPSLGKGEQFLITGPTVDPLFKVIFGGLNFAWWDATGPLRAYSAGDNRLLADVPFIAATDATFQTLVGNLASFIVAYLNDVAAPNSGGSPTAGDLWVTGISCQP